MHIITFQAVRKAALSVALLLILGFSVRAETIVVDNDDGSATVVIDGEEHVIPAALAAGIVGALAAHADDPQRLRSAIRDIVAASADTMDSTVLAAFAAFESGGDHRAVEAIIAGVADGDPSVSVPMLLSVLPEGGADLSPPGAGVAFGTNPPGTVLFRGSRPRTLEEPSQVSPRG